MDLTSQWRRIKDHELYFKTTSDNSLNINYIFPTWETNSQSFTVLSSKVSLCNVRQQVLWTRCRYMSPLKWKWNFSATGLRCDSSISDHVTVDRVGMSLLCAAISNCRNCETQMSTCGQFLLFGFEFWFGFLDTVYFCFVFYHSTSRYSPFSLPMKSWESKKIKRQGWKNRYFPFCTASEPSKSILTIILAKGLS